jgi:hypothetical protein
LLITPSGSVGEPEVDAEDSAKSPTRASSQAAKIFLVDELGLLAGNLNKKKHTLLWVRAALRRKWGQANERSVGRDGMGGQVPAPDRRKQNKSRFQRE